MNDYRRVETVCSTQEKVMSIYQFPRATTDVAEQIFSIFDKEFGSNNVNAQATDEVELRVAAALCMVFEEILNSPTIRTHHPIPASVEKTVRNLLDSCR